MTGAGDGLDLATLAEAGVTLVQMEVPDIDGVLRGKFVSPGKVVPGAEGAICTIWYQFTSADDVWLSRHSSFDNGFPDIVARPDPSTAVRWSWRPDTAAVIFDIFGVDGDPYALSPRTLLRRVADRFADTGFEPVFGIELETFVLHADEELMAAGRHHELRPLGRMHNAYRLAEAEEARDLGAEFIRRMAGVGITIDAFHTELGYGAIEFAMAPSSPLKAADDAMRAKSYFRQLCAERGLAATFMAKWKIGESGAGGHVHQSLRRGGRNVFHDPETGDFSSAARRHLAGLIETMPDFALLFRPNVNSYRRFDHHAWAPENASWGQDNRSAAVRAIRHPSPKGFRFEHRVPGADANVYLTIAAMLAGAHLGITREAEPPEPAAGNAALEERFAALPRTLPEAIASFRDSPVARDYFGADFVEHYAASREVEWRHWLDWQASQVTAFELKRYFDTL